MATETEMLEQVAAKLGVNVSELPDRLESTLLRQAITASGGSCDNLPDNLKSTLLKQLAETCGGGGGGVIRWDYENSHLKEVPANVYMELALGFRNVSIPNATAIREYAFSDCGLTSIDAPLAEVVEDYAFSDCTFLASINLPKVKTIGLMGFGRVRGLTYVCLPEATEIGESAFSTCTLLKKIDLPKVSSIGQEAFVNSINLETIIIRNTEQVATIDFSAVLGTKLDPRRSGGIEGYLYIPSSMDAAYRAAYEPVFEQIGAAGLYDILFRKIEDWPEICG